MANVNTTAPLALIGAAFLSALILVGGESAASGAPATPGTGGSPAASTPGALGAITSTVTATPSGTVSGATLAPVVTTASTPAASGPAVPTSLDPPPKVDHPRPNADSLGPGDEIDGVDFQENAPAGGAPHNIVRLLNRQDNRLRVRGRAQLNHINGPTAQPVNEAIAYASCTDCQTMAVALQLNLISKAATTVTPQNAAIALNYQCTSCTTIARAIQYNFIVDDPNQVLPRVRQLLDQMNRELNRIQDEPNVTPDQAEAEISAVIVQFQDLAQNLDQQQDEKTDNTTPGAPPVGQIVPTTGTPSPSATIGSVAPAAGATPALSPSPGVGGSPTASPTGQPVAVTMSPTATVSTRNWLGSKANEWGMERTGPS